MTLHAAQPDKFRFAKLTKREREILFLMAKEKCAKDIAGELQIGVATVRSHRKNIYVKLDVRKSAGAIMKGFEHGYLRFS